MGWGNRRSSAALAERIERLGRIMATPPTADTLKYFSNETIKTYLEQKGEAGELPWDFVIQTIPEIATFLSLHNPIP